MIRRTLETLAAGCAVYVLMAACSGTNASHVAQGSDAGASSGGADGAGGAGTGVAGAQAGQDGGLLNPVPDASAQTGGAPGCDCEPYTPPESTVVEAECLAQDGAATRFAVGAFPGKTESELSGVIALVQYDPDKTSDFPASFPSGFGTQVGVVYVKDGFAATQCGSSAFYADSVTFILP